eukprot:jgi/Tetstr1/443642/TSEL_031640.t1
MRAVARAATACRRLAGGGGSDPSGTGARLVTAAYGSYSDYGEEGSRHGDEEASGDVAFAQYADRGSGWYKSERDRLAQASLVETGRHAGRSRVRVDDARGLLYHIWKRDFFTSLLSLSLIQLFGLICCLETGIWLLWALVWYTYHHSTGGQCMGGFDAMSYYKSIYDALLFSIETQQTIGYGARFPKDCTVSVLILSMQCLTQLLLEASCVGLVFARLSHPKSRGRSIFISESSVISRRDGALKFMFRIADVRQSQVMNPKITAYLYTLPRRTTAEGEKLPFRTEELKLNFTDGVLLLPVILEHTIDNGSPLYGHSHETLMNMSAEVVVTFEGATETGSTFSARQSYMPNEIHWGHMFRQIIKPAVPPDTQHSVSMGRFHEVEPQPGLAMMTPRELSRRVMVPERGVVPYPDLMDNTLVLSDSLVVCSRGSRTFLMARIGDTCPRSTVTVSVRMYLYRWKRRVTPQGEILPFQMHPLDLRSGAGPEGTKGSPNFEVTLRLPHLVMHEITPDSPLASWSAAANMLQGDADSEVLVQITGIKAQTGLPTTTKNTYRVACDIYWGHHFQAMVTPPSLAHHKPVVNWSIFHAILPHRQCALSPQTSGMSAKASAPDPRRTPNPAHSSVWDLPPAAPGARGSDRTLHAKPREAPQRSGHSTDEESDGAPVDGNLSPQPPDGAPASDPTAPERSAAHVRFAAEGRAIGRSLSDSGHGALTAPGGAPSQAGDHGAEFACAPTQQAASSSRSSGTGVQRSSDWKANRSLAGLSFTIDDDDPLLSKSPK